MKLICETCEICREKIEKNDKIIKLQIGRSNGSGIKSAIFGDINYNKENSFALAHQLCCEMNPEENPVKQMDDIFDDF